MPDNLICGYMDYFAEKYQKIDKQNYFKFRYTELLDTSPLTFRIFLDWMLHGVLRTDKSHNIMNTWIEIYHLGGRLEAAGLRNDALREINKLPVRGISLRVSFWKAWRKAERGAL